LDPHNVGDRLTPVVDFAGQEVKDNRRWIWRRGRGIILNQLGSTPAVFLVFIIPSVHVSYRPSVMLNDVDIYRNCSYHNHTFVAVIITLH